jgi:hypothetical protein
VSGKYTSATSACIEMAEGSRSHSGVYRSDGSVDDHGRFMATLLHASVQLSSSPAIVSTTHGACAEHVGSLP